MIKKFLVLITSTSMFLMAPLLVRHAESQEPDESPSPGEEQPCVVGQLCLDVGREVKPGQFKGPVNDPPGNYARSLVTMGAIAALILAYLYIALSGKRIRLPFVSSRAGRAS